MNILFSSNAPYHNQAALASLKGPHLASQPLCSYCSRLPNSDSNSIEYTHSIIPYALCKVYHNHTHYAKAAELRNWRWNSISWENRRDFSFLFVFEAAQWNITRKICRFFFQLREKLQVSLYIPATLGSWARTILYRRCSWILHPHHFNLNFLFQCHFCLAQIRPGACLFVSSQWIFPIKINLSFTLTLACKWCILYKWNKKGYKNDENNVKETNRWATLTMNQGKMKRFLR